MIHQNRGLPFRHIHVPTTMTLFGHKIEVSLRAPLSDGQADQAEKHLNTVSEAIEVSNAGDKLQRLVMGMGDDE